MERKSRRGQPQIFTEKKNFLQRRDEVRRQGMLMADLHVHSSQSDGCHSLKRLAARGRELGMSLAVTDHNRIPDLRGLTAEEAACLIPAIEVTSREYVDLLCYFYDFAGLEEFYRTVVAPHRLRPYMISLSLNEILAAVGERRCMVTVPHPDYPADRLRTNFMRLMADGRIDAGTLAPVDCIEVFNASRDRTVCSLKMQLAVRLGKVPVVGSDAHTRGSAGNSLVYGRVQSHAELLELVAAGRACQMAMPTGLADRSAPKLKMAWLHIKGLLAGS